MLKNRIGYLLLIIACVYFAVLFSVYSSAALLCFVVVIPILIGLPVLVWKCMVGAKMAAEETVEELGTEAKIKIVIKNPSFFPILNGQVHVRCKHQLDKEAQTVQASFSVDARGKQKIEIPFICKHCGEITIELVKLRMIDYLGLFAGNKKTTAKTSVVVIPRLDTVLEKEAQADGEQRDADYSLDLYAETGQELKEIREYLPGDSMKQIHWKASAKQKKMMTKVLENPQETDELLCFALLYDKEEELSFKWYDERLCSLAYQSMELIMAGIHHEVVWYHPEYQTFTTTAIKEMVDLMGLLENIVLAGVGKQTEEYQLELQRYIMVGMKNK